MKISVVTVCYNSVDTIEETMLSVLNQTYPDVEYIIIDGGSTDGTVDIIKKYAGRVAYWISEPDKGIYDAMNKGIAAATGDYINFMNSGDRFASTNVIENCFSNLRGTPIIIYGNWIESVESMLIPKKALELGYLSKGMPFPHQSAFIAVSYHKYHPYCLNFPIAADYNLFYNAVKQGVEFRYIDEYISVYDMNPEESISLKNQSSLIREHLLIQGMRDKKKLEWVTSMKMTEIRIRRRLKELLPSKMVKQVKLFLDRFRKHSDTYNK